MTDIILRRPMSWFLRPFEIYDEFDDYLDKFWNDFPLGIPDDITEFRIPRSELKELDDEFIMELELPGLDKEDVKFEITNNRILEIKGERRTSEKEVEEGKFEKTEKHHSTFYQKIKLPKEIKTDEIDAKMENGLLMVHLPKMETKEEKTKIKVE
ncbi:MAG: Hsp20/alpha crystallin family protein [Candidatus Helarchaeota archaeon]